ncbi:MAG TPA: hypothetical protein PLA68_07340 [Panacibacter sp.]|nr:hypothetical protein [Panacibacter sp.]
MEDLSNILQNDDQLNEAELKKYLSGDMDAEELHAMEKKMAGSAFADDAVEGLKAFTSQKKLDDYVSQLNKNLHQQLDNKKLRKEKRRITDMPWIIVAVITILLLCILAFVVIKMQRDKQAVSKSLSVQVFSQGVNDTNNLTT